MPPSPRAPKKAAAPDEEAIRHRAYEISHSTDAGTPEENWLRAEQELRSAITESTPRKAAKPKAAPKPRAPRQTKKTDEP